MNRLKREPIITKLLQDESVIEFPKLEITLDEKIYDISDLAALENIHVIVKTLKIYLKTQRNRRAEPYRVCRRVNILRDYPDDKIKIYP